MKHRKGWFVLGAAAVLATAVMTSLAVAGNRADNPPGISAITNPPAVDTTKPAKKPKFITVRLWSGPYQKAFAASVAKQFTKATGVGVHWDTTDELVSYQKIDQQIRSGIRPQADASMQAQQRAYLDAVRGLTLPISLKLAPNMKKAVFAIAAPQGTPKSAEAWAYTNPYSVTVSLVVNTDKVTAKINTDSNEWGATAAKWMVGQLGGKGKIIIMNGPAGISVSGRVGASEDDVSDTELEDHIVAWPARIPRAARSKRRPR